ncbi:hypothetical protein [Mycolicibacterium iranicum]|uniref:Uncharacterized protein n=1 Tax=Mycolicibacterium iranicum TaxID=912594 RepID=A0ABT4HRY8_MYCIR|nr:hypothetical protein [Mycolicibacterium iranicum]MCZ0732509.1 hypothetical protein [Mycolicibacterium iranicum]
MDNEDETAQLRDALGGELPPPTSPVGAEIKARYEALAGGLRVSLEKLTNDQPPPAPPA